MDILTILTLGLILSGCSSVKEAGLFTTEVVRAPGALLDPDLHKSEWPEAYDRASDAPPEEWEILKVGKWKQDKYDKKRAEECRPIRKRHIPTGVLEDTYECRPKAPDDVTADASR